MNHQSVPTLTEEEVAVLARYAGLAISEERLPMIAREVNIAKQAVQDLLSVPTSDVTGVAGRFDPTWLASTTRGAKRGVS